MVELNDIRVIKSFNGNFLISLNRNKKQQGSTSSANNKNSQKQQFEMNYMHTPIPNILEKAAVHKISVSGTFLMTQLTHTKKLKIV